MLEFRSPTEDEWFETQTTAAKIEHLEHNLAMLRQSNEYLLRNWSRGNPDRIDRNDDEILRTEALLEELRDGA